MALSYAEISLIFFALAILGGATMLVMRLMDKGVPVFLGLGHGLIGAAGLVFVILAVVLDGKDGLFMASIGLLVVAAIVGSIVFVQHVRKIGMPIPLILIHAGIALAAFVLALIGVLTT